MAGVGGRQQADIERWLRALYECTDVLSATAHAQEAVRLCHGTNARAVAFRDVFFDHEFLTKYFDLMFGDSVESALAPDLTYWFSTVDGARTVEYEDKLNENDVKWLKALPPRERDLCEAARRLGGIWNITVPLGMPPTAAGRARGMVTPGVMGGGAMSDEQERSLFSLSVGRSFLLSSRRLPPVTRLILDATNGYLPAPCVTGGAALAALKLVDPLLVALAARYSYPIKRGDMLPRLPTGATPAAATPAAGSDADVSSWPHGVYVSLHDLAICYFVRCAANPNRRHYVRPFYLPDGEDAAAAWDASTPMAAQPLAGAQQSDAERHIARVHHALVLRIRGDETMPLAYRTLASLTRCHPYNDILFQMINTLLPTSSLAPAHGLSDIFHAAVCSYWLLANPASLVPLPGQRSHAQPNALGVRLGLPSEASASGGNSGGGGGGDDGGGWGRFSMAAGSAKKGGGGGAASTRTAVFMLSNKSVKATPGGGVVNGGRGNGGGGGSGVAFPAMVAPSYTPPLPSQCNALALVIMMQHCDANFVDVVSGRAKPGSGGPALLALAREVVDARPPTQGTALVTGRAGAGATGRWAGAQSSAWREGGAGPSTGCGLRGDVYGELKELVAPSGGEGGGGGGTSGDAYASGTPHSPRRHLPGPSVMPSTLASMQHAWFTYFRIHFKRLNPLTSTSEFVKVADLWLAMLTPWRARGRYKSEYTPPDPSCRSLDYGEAAARVAVRHATLAGTVGPAGFTVAPAPAAALTASAGPLTLPARMTPGGVSRIDSAWNPAATGAAGANGSALAAAPTNRVPAGVVVGLLRCSDPEFVDKSTRGHDFGRRLIPHHDIADWAPYIATHYAFYTFLFRELCQSLGRTDFSIPSVSPLLALVERVLDVYEPALTALLAKMGHVVGTLFEGHGEGSTAGGGAHRGGGGITTPTAKATRGGSPTPHRRTTSGAATGGHHHHHPHHPSGGGGGGPMPLYRGADLDAVRTQLLAHAHLLQLPLDVSVADVFLSFHDAVSVSASQLLTQLRQSRGNVPLPRTPPSLYQLVELDTAATSTSTATAATPATGKAIAGDVVPPPPSGPATLIRRISQHVANDALPFVAQGWSWVKARAPASALPGLAWVERVVVEVWKALVWLVVGVWTGCSITYAAITTAAVTKLGERANPVHWPGVAWAWLRRTVPLLSSMGGGGGRGGVGGDGVLRGDGRPTADRLQLVADRLCLAFATPAATTTATSAPTTAFSSHSPGYGRVAGGEGTAWHRLLMPLMPIQLQPLGSRRGGGGGGFSLFSLATLRAVAWYVLVWPLWMATGWTLNLGHSGQAASLTSLALALAPQTDLEEVGGDQRASTSTDGGVGTAKFGTLTPAGKAALRSARATMTGHDIRFRLPSAFRPAGTYEVQALVDATDRATSRLLAALEWVFGVGTVWSPAPCILAELERRGREDGEGGTSHEVEGEGDDGVARRLALTTSLPHARGGGGGRPSAVDLRHQLLLAAIRPPNVLRPLADYRVLLIVVVAAVVSHWYWFGAGPMMWICLSGWGLMAALVALPEQVPSSPPSTI